MNTEQLRQWDNSCLWHPFAPMQAYCEEGAPIIEVGDGFDLIDIEGRRYLDGISSLWCNVHGHRVPEIDAAVREQLDRIAHSTLLGCANPPAVALAHRLVEQTPAELTKVFYSDSGSTAVEIALKMAYQYHRQKPGGPEPRSLFVSLAGAYHGDTVGSVSVGGIDLFHHIYGDLLFKTLKLPAPVPYLAPAGSDAAVYLDHCYHELEKTITAHHAQIAAFVIEPLVQGAAGIWVHADGYLKRVRELTAEFQIPLIADEVAVGFGRTGTMFACEQEDVCPDLLCLAKGISGGYLPLAATLATDEIYNAFLGDPAEGRTFYHGHTYTGNPLACAAGLASLDLFEKNRVLENVRANAELLESRLNELADHPHVGDIRQQGVMVGIELVKDRDTKTGFPPSRRMGHQVTIAARKRGVMVRPLGDVVVLMPAPAMPAESIHRLCDVVFEAIDDVVKSPPVAVDNS